MLHKALQKGHGMKCDGASILGAERDFILRHIQKAGIGDAHAVRVAPEILDDVAGFADGPRPNFLDHQEGVINGRQSGTRQGDAGGEPLRSSRRQWADHALLLLNGPAARVENA